MARSQAPAPNIPLYERHMQAFLVQRGTQVDAQAAVFNLDHAAADVIVTLEGLALRPHELTHAGFVLLMTLWITGPRETRELASVLRVTKGAIVGSVNTLERRGLVRRLRSDIDRRLITVELTDDGRALISGVQEEWRALEVEVTGDLTLEEKRTLAALCRKIADSARKLRKRRGLLSGLPEPAEFLDASVGSKNGA
ncbi:MAG: MarR family transcriptional regulator [Chloroflexota bacterium]